MYGSQTPIDINCSKLVDWLVQRRHCRKDWGENLANIRRKIRVAIKDMPESEEIRDLLIGSKLDYFKSKRIVEILKTTEASSKNIFGYYSSQRMKDWQDIVSSYERDYVYLAEIATDLIRETNYEVPGIRKVINKLKTDKDEAEKSKANLLRRAQQFQSEHQKMAQSYGIKGTNVVAELAEQSKTLASVMEEIVGLTKDLKSGLDNYREFASLTSSLDSSKFVPILSYVIEKGNTTVYEWKHGEAPEKIELVEKSTNPTEISNPSEMELIIDEIDFGDEVDPPSSESSSGFVHVNQSDNGNGSGNEETFVKVEDDSRLVCASNDKTARGDEAKFVLEFRNTRLQFLNNLCELEAFLDQILSDLSSEDNDSNSFLQNINSRARRFDAQESSQILTRIRQVMSILNKDRNKILFQMNDSTSFVDNLSDKFAQKAKQATECTTKAELLDARIREIEMQIKDTEIHLKKSIVSAKELQEKVGHSLRDLYKGRSINIMGCVG